MQNFYNRRARWGVFIALAVCLGSTQPTYALDREFSSVTVSNTTTATSIYSFVVPANLLSTARGFRLQIWGTYLQNQGNNRTLTLRVNFGGTTILTDNSTNVVDANGTTGNFMFETVILNAGSANAQRGYLHFLWDRGAGTPTFLEFINTTTTSAIDTTTDQTLSVTVQHSNANNNISLIKQGAIMSLL